MKKTMTLIILDGFGCNTEQKGNAICRAHTPHLEELFQTYSHTQISASGPDVGLPEGQMGNSEVGHTNIGAGRIVYQELLRISNAVKDGSLFENETLCAAMRRCVEKGTALHLFGLLSDGGVHSHNTHLYALVELAHKLGVKEVWVHCFLDGRDVSPASGKEFVEQLQAKLDEIGTGRIASVMGRYYAMDRDNRWERVELAYRAIARADAPVVADAAEAVGASYEEEVTDEFVVPVVTEGYPGVKPEDSIIFYNFRPDRAREITRTFVDPEFDGFEREFFPVHYVCMTQYDAAMPNVSVAFRPEALTNTFGEYISKQGLTQLRIAETEKYAHVTFFFNGGVEKTYEGEDRILVDSPKVATYDLQPEMSAPEVTEKVCEQICSGKYDVIILNFANCDMVGHTGVFQAAVKAVETVDACVGKVMDAIKSVDGIALLTADHGNADCMVDPKTGEPFTAHTTNPVPLLLNRVGVDLRSDGRLADLAPTMLELMGLPQPPEMTGKSLIEHV